ncbi:MAG: PilZ domain-containing protein [Archangium sp.]|nr:PilZ domain-containing protein [Archangium sp.]MDP3151977.1 PilZ domain-containing protein [Archangium sp.]MDP3571390.1 PilZ domain-containing protein [Archangium sp.]
MAEKKKKQTEDERRDSPRVPMEFLVRDVGLRDGEWEERKGDLSLGGISWRGKTAPHGTEVDVRFRLPLVPKEVRARGEILRVKAAGVGIDFHLRFTELEVRAELAIARYLDEWLSKQR